MFARTEGTKVRLYLPFEDPEVYLGPLSELIEAREDHDRNQPDLSTVDLQPYVDRLAAAEGDVEYLFSELLDIEHAERVLRSLEKAILHAKVAEGRFNREDADVIPFPYPRFSTPKDAA
jgi:phytoene/squalene synthetase